MFTGMCGTRRYCPCCFECALAGVAPGVDDAVKDGVNGGIDALAGRVGFEPGDSFAGAIAEGNAALEVGNEALEFSAVEDGWGALIALEFGCHVRSDMADEIGGDVLNIHTFDAESEADFLNDLIPGEDGVASDLDGLADGLVKAAETGEADGEIAGVGEGPESLAVVVDKDRAFFFESSGEGITGASDGVGQPLPGVGVRGPDDGDGEAVLAVLLHEKGFGGGFVLAIGREGVADGRQFGDGQHARGLAVDDDGADEDILGAAAGEEFDHGAGVIFGVGREVGDDIKGFAGEGLL